MQNAKNVTVAARIASTSSNLAENRSPAKTSRFLTHSCGRMALMAARTGPRRGRGDSPSEGGSSVTAGLSIVAPSIGAGRLGVDQHAGVEDRPGVELALGGAQRGRERLRPLTVVP